METKKKKSIILYVILFIAGSVAVYFFSNQTEDDEIGRLKRNLEIAERDIVHYKNKNDELIAEVESKSYTQKEMKEFEAETLKRIKEIAGDVKAVKQYVKFKSQVRDTVFIATDTTIFIVDKAGQQVDSLPFKYQDKYMTLNGEYKPDGTTIDYSYDPVYEIIASWKKPEGDGFFKKNRLMVDVVAENPKETVTDINAIEVEVPRKSFLNSKAFWTGLASALTLILNNLIFKR